MLLNSLLIVVLLAMPAAGQGARCADCAVWNAPQEPFKIYANTYYVGPHGLSAILITSAAGHILIDGALPESAPLIAASIRKLGFRVEDIRLIVNSHAHFDHAGGIAELARMSGARIALTEWSARVLRSGAVARDDPQFGSIHGSPRIARAAIVRDGETLDAGDLHITAHFTPGHTPAGTSWTWRSCDGAKCADLVYADSLSAVSAPGFRFTGPPAASFEKSFAFLESAKCDILLTPHPEAANLWERVSKPGSMIAPEACKQLAAGARQRLQRRLDSERSR